MFLFPPGRSLLFLSCVFYSVISPVASWDTDLELFDLVEEIPQTFYQFLSVDKVGSTQSAAEWPYYTGVSVAGVVLTL